MKLPSRQRSGGCCCSETSSLSIGSWMELVEYYCSACQQSRGMTVAPPDRNPKTSPSQILRQKPDESDGLVDSSCGVMTG